MTTRAHWMVRSVAIAGLLLAVAWRIWMAVIPDASTTSAAQTSIEMMRPVASSQKPSLAPLFAEASASPAEDADDGTGLTLIGIAGRLPDDVQVILRLPDGRTTTLSPGGKIDEWTLLSVAADRAILTNGDQQKILNIAH